MRPVRCNLILSVLFATGFAFALSPSAVANPDGEALAADRSFTAAVIKADQASVGKLLDSEFTWTDRTGKTRSRVEILPALASLAADNDANVKVIDAGQVVLIHGNDRVPSQNATVRFIRIWVKRPQAWQLLVYQETTKAEKNPEKRSGFGAPSNGTPVACENPCTVVPYKPDTPSEQEVVSSGQALERTG